MWVMGVVWWLCVCVSRERYLRMPSCQSTNDFSHPRLTLVQSTITVIVHHIDFSTCYCTDYLDQSRLSLT